MCFRLMILNSNNNLSSAANGGGEKEGWETTTDAEKEGWAATTDKDGCQPEYCENQAKSLIYANGFYKYIDLNVLLHVVEVISYYNELLE